MVLKQHTAAAGTPGATVTTANSGGGSGDPFNTVTIGADAELQYAIKAGATCLRTASPATGSPGGKVAWTLVSQTRVAGRIELYLPSPGAVDPAGFGSGVIWEYLKIAGTNITLLTTAWDTVAGTPTAFPTGLRGYESGVGELFIAGNGTIPLDTWFRLEWDFVLTNPGGTWEVNVYPDRSTLTPSSTFGGPRTWAVTTATAIEYGPSSGLGGEYFFTGLQLNDSGLPGPRPLPTTNPAMSTLVDPFSRLDSSKWTSAGTVASVAGTLQLGDTTTTPIPSALTSVRPYVFDRAELEIRDAVPGGLTLLVYDTDDYVKITINPSGWALRAEWSIAGVVDTSGDEVTYDAGTHKYLKMVRDFDADTVAFMVSGDGATWDTLHTLDVDDARFTAAHASIAGLAMTTVDNFNIPVGVPYEPPEDLFDPTAPAPPSPANPDGVTPTCLSLIEIVRQFSSQIRRPIRFTGPFSIEIVDITTPLPAGWTEADAAALYAATTDELSAGATTMSLEPDLLALAVSGELVADDVRVLTSAWQVPHQLPVHQLGTGLVRRVSQTFTPTGYRASVEFAVRPIPTSAIRS